MIRNVKLYMGLIALGATASFAGITYDGSTTVTILNYSATNPATLADLRAADAAGGWGIIQYIPATDTTTLNKNLVIGATDGAESFLQIGLTNALTELLVMQGNVTVKAPASGKRNGLILGASLTNTVQPALIFDGSNRQYSLKTEAGVFFQCYNARVDSMTTNQWCGNFNNNNVGEIYLTNSVIKHGYLYPFQSIHGVVANCTFADGPVTMQNGDGCFEQCIFSNLDIAINDYGSVDCTAISCTFTNNAQNWNLKSTDQGIRAVDCFIGTPRNTNIVCQRWWNADKGIWHYPVFFAQRHFVVAAKNGGGDPITNATVTISNEQEYADAVVHGLAVTGTNGQTPAVNSGQALFVMDYLYRATADPAQPEAKHYTYTITVAAPGYSTNQVSGVDPDESWTTREIVLSP